MADADTPLPAGTVQPSPNDGIASGAGAYGSGTSSRDGPAPAGATKTGASAATQGGGTSAAASGGVASDGTPRRRFSARHTPWRSLALDMPPVLPAMHGGMAGMHKGSLALREVPMDFMVLQGRDLSARDSNGERCAPTTAPTLCCCFSADLNAYSCVSAQARPIPTYVSLCVAQRTQQRGVPCWHALASGTGTAAR